ncbi:MAG: LysE family translocator [Pseudomonadota bacterium]
MTFSLLLALIGFAFAATFTPGPNNLMLLASGASFGLRRTVPHMLGVAVGFGVLVLLVGLGISQVFVVYPVARTVLKLLGIAYLAWLAWKIATAVPAEPGRVAGQPLTFLQAAGFQWVNPKALTMSLTAVTVYSPGTGFLSISIVALVFTVVCLPSVGCWAMLGDRMRGLLTDPIYLRRFNLAMAGLLLASALPAILA